MAFNIIRSFIAVDANIEQNYEIGKITVLFSADESASRIYNIVATLWFRKSLLIFKDRKRDDGSKLQEFLLTDLRRYL